MGKNERPILGLSREQAKSRILLEMTQHIGQARAIGMGELFETVFRLPWKHRINDTRPLRDLITELRRGEKPQPICSTANNAGPGYYLAQTGPELEDYIANIEKQALKKLGLAARLRRQPLPKLLGQMALKMQPAQEG